MSVDAEPVEHQRCRQPTDPERWGVLRAWERRGPGLPEGLAEWERELVAAVSNPEDYEPDPDDLTRAELAELAHLPYGAVAEALDAWLARNHGILSSHHHAGDFLDELAARGWEVVPKPPVPSLDELLEPSKD